MYTAKAMAYCPTSETDDNRATATVTTRFPALERELTSKALPGRAIQRRADRALADPNRESTRAMSMSRFRRSKGDGGEKGLKASRHRASRLVAGYPFLPTATQMLSVQQGQVSESAQTGRQAAGGHSHAATRLFHDVAHQAGG